MAARSSCEQTFPAQKVFRPGFCAVWVAHCSPTHHLTARELQGKSSPVFPSTSCLETEHVWREESFKKKKGKVQ